MAIGEGASADLKGTLARRGAKVAAEALRLIGDGIRFAVPNSWVFLNEFGPDLFHELAGELEKPEHQQQGTPPPAAQQLADEITKVARAIQPVFELDEPTRNAFFGWYDSSDERKGGFIKFAIGATPEQIKKFASSSVGERDYVIKQLPKEKKSMTYLELRKAIAADAATNQQVTDFLTRLATLRGNVSQTLAFWESVRSAVERKQINSLENFQQLMALTDPEVVQFLGLESRPLLPSAVRQLPTKINADIAATSVSATLEGWITRLKTETGL